MSELLTRIENDHRNVEFPLLRAGTVEWRDFGEWSMASTVANADSFGEMLETFMADKAAAAQVLSRFILEGRWHA
ncbi:MAG: BLUF domain-containing protein [Rhodocyclaceae bacterium]|nr:BLUF domain-containing protein [Rhodocyclaceae bacterium]